MDQVRIDQAMNRIEAALTRVEQAACKPPVEAGEIAARHSALRQRVGGALEELDRLIGAIER